MYCSVLRGGFGAAEDVRITSSELQLSELGQPFNNLCQIPVLCKTGYHALFKEIAGERSLHACRWAQAEACSLYTNCCDFPFSQTLQCDDLHLLRVESECEDISLNQKRRRWERQRIPAAIWLSFWRWQPSSCVLVVLGWLWHQYSSAQNIGLRKRVWERQKPTDWRLEIDVSVWTLEKVEDWKLQRWVWGRLVFNLHACVFVVVLAERTFQSKVFITPWIV